MVRLIHLADLHLGWQPRFVADRSVAESYADERYGVFQAAIDYAADPVNSVSALVIAGDLFDDHRPAPALVERVLAGLARLAARGVATVVAPGNHDEVTYADSVYRRYGDRWPGTLATSPAMTHLASISSRDQDMHFYGMAYTGGVTDAARPIESFPRIDRPGVHVAIIHGTAVGARGYGSAAGPDWTLAERSLPLDATALAAAGYDYVALGHIHRHGPVGGAGSRICYAGQVAARGFDDPGCGFLTLVEFGAGGAAPVIRHLPLKFRQFREVEVDVAGEPSLDALLATCGGAVANVPAGSFVRLRLSGVVNAAADIASLESALAARCGFAHLEVRDETSILGPEQIRQWSVEPTVRGFFVRRLLGGAAEQGRDPKLVERAIRHGLAALSGRKL